MREEETATEEVGLDDLKEPTEQAESNGWSSFIVIKVLILLFDLCLTSPKNKVRLIIKVSKTNEHNSVEKRFQSWPIRHSNVRTKL